MPDEGQDQRTYQNYSEAYLTHESSFDLGDCVVAEWVGYQGRRSYHKATDEYVEIELCDHECWGIEEEEDRVLHQGGTNRDPSE